jgi:HK97 family phage prohead protease
MPANPIPPIKAAVASPERHAADRATSEIERRVYHGTVAMRTDGDATAPKLSGYAAVFDHETLIGSPSWGFREQVAQGAFTQAIKDDDVRGLFNHDANFVLGRTKSKTLRLSEDETGLRYEIDPPDTTAGRDLVQLVTRGDIDASSFAFIVTKDSWDYSDKEQPPLRTVQQVQLFDVSPVTYPAYPTTTVTISSRAQQMASPQQRAAAIVAPTVIPPAAATRDDGSTGGGSTGDVGGDVGGMESSKAAIKQAVRDVATAKKSVRAMKLALDISHGFSPSDGNLSGKGGPKLDTGRSADPEVLSQARKDAAALIRDRRDDGDSGATDTASATMYYASRSCYRSMLAGEHAMNAVRTMCRDAGIDLSTDADDTGTAAGSSTDGSDGSATGSDAGAAGANAATLVDLDLRRRKLALERLR